MTRQTADAPVPPAAVPRRTAILCAVALATLLLGCAADPSRQLWRDVSVADALEGYEAFLKRYPDSPFAGEARDRIMALHWRDAEAANTVTHYDAFIERYPADRLAAEARRRAGDLDWPRVERLKSIRVYRDFLARYPESRHAATARTRIAALAHSQSQGLVKDSQKIAARVAGQRGVDSAPLPAPSGGEARPGIEPDATGPRPAQAAADRPGFRAARMYINSLPHWFYRSARGRYAVRDRGRDIRYVHVELEIGSGAAFDFEFSVRDRRGRRLQRHDQTLFEDGGLVFPPGRAPGFSGYPFHTAGIVYYAVESVVHVPFSGGGFVRSMWRLTGADLAGATLRIGGWTIPLRPFAEPARRGWVALPLDRPPDGASRD